MEAETSRSRKVQDWLPLAILIAIIVALYGPSLKGDFLLIGDPAEVITEPRKNYPDLATALIEVWRNAEERPRECPLTRSTRVIDGWIWGTNATGHRLTSLLWLIGLTIVYFALFRRGLKTSPVVAAMGAAFFALAPPVGSTVVWLAQRELLAFATFPLLIVAAQLPFKKWVTQHRLANIILIAIIVVISSQIALGHGAGIGIWATMVSFFTVLVANVRPSWALSIFVPPLVVTMFLTILALPKYRSDTKLLESRLLNDDDKETLTCLLELQPRDLKQAREFTLMLDSITWRQDISKKELSRESLEQAFIEKSGFGKQPDADLLCARLQIERGEIELARRQLTGSHHRLRRSVALGELELYHAGDIAAAIPHFRAALDIAPYHPDARQGLGVALIRSGEFEEGFAILTELMRDFPHMTSAAEFLQRQMPQ